jgi:hypothetical protein
MPCSAIRINNIAGEITLYGETNGLIVVETGPDFNLNTSESVRGFQMNSHQSKTFLNLF